MALPSDDPASSYELTSSLVGPGVVVARVDGELDYLVTPHLRRRLFDQLDAARAVLVLDLDGVSLLSAAAMEMLLGLDVLGEARGCELRVVAAARTVRRPLSLTGLDERLRLFETVDAALDGESRGTLDPC